MRNLYWIAPWRDLGAGATVAKSQRVRSDDGELTTSGGGRAEWGEDERKRTTSKKKITPSVAICQPVSIMMRRSLKDLGISVNCPLEYRSLYFSYCIGETLIQTDTLHSFQLAETLCRAFFLKNLSSDVQKFCSASGNSSESAQ